MKLSSTNFPFPDWIVFPAGTLGYIAYSFPVGVTVWLLIDADGAVHLIEVSFLGQKWGFPSSKPCF